MENKSFKEILKMVVNACDYCFYSGIKDAKEKVIECATQIYIAQFKEGEKNDR